MTENEFHLTQSTDQLQQLTRRLLSVQEEERRALSRELHDDFGQQLIALKLNLSTLDQLLRNYPPYPAPHTGHNSATAVQRCTADCIDITNHIIGRVREIAHHLRPSILDDLGLSATLHGYTQRQAQRAGCTIEVRDCIPSLSPDVEIAAFRIVQEAVSNAIRHGAAPHITVVAQFDKSVLRLVIQDNGSGFDPDELSARPESGMGLITMSERARLLGGQLTHTSRPGMGTRIEVTIPVEVSESP